MSPPSLYVHVPFCHSECSYCDFYRVSYRDDAAEAFLGALAKELATLPRDWVPPTIYVGGGTPSALREEQLESLLEALAPFRSPAQEYTFEVNPKSANRQKIDLLAQAGVNRVSFGAQTFDAPLLKLLGRRHGPDDIRRVYGMLREKIQSISFDLIFGLPTELIELWERDLEAAIHLSPDHLSVYSLIHEPNTPLTLSIERGEFAAQPEEVEREMYLLAIDRLGDAGYEHYEVSSFARAGHRSAHNQAYWRQDDYYGVGPGATSTIGPRRYSNLRNLGGYVQGIERAGIPPRAEERLGLDDRIREHLMMWLRTSGGLSLSVFESLSGTSLSRYSNGAFERLAALGLLQVSGDIIRLTREGLCVADRVIVELMA